MKRRRKQAAEQNAKVVEQQREQANRQNLDEAEQLKARRDIIAGQNRAAFGAAGLGMTSGTGLDLLAANYGVYDEDKEKLNYNLQNDDYNRRVEYAGQMDKAASARSAAKSAKNPMGTILSAASSLYGLPKVASGGGAVRTLDKSYRGY